ncbi:IclR family transcriptional regulator C-terminal domain-containing protein [Streptomyces sp. NPDC002580]|uniref:IclR family transcriptional regulator domain-containing protein n=1 Tax=Streptomyces sp. NPDC002580 TaxID=3364653 RepID=UPI0036B8C206
MTSRHSGCRRYTRRRDPAGGRVAVPPAGKVLVASARPGLPLGPLPASRHREAAVVREDGVAFDREEPVTGVCCVAVPLKGPDGVTVAAPSAVTDSAHRLDRLADIVRRAGRTVGAGLRIR